MKRRGRLTLQGTLEQASTALEYLMQQLAPFGSSRDRDAVELGAAEVLSNIVRHGYGGAPGRIRVTWSADEARIGLSFGDTGQPIPHGALDEARHTSLDFRNTGISDLPESGLGLALVRRAFHEVGYRSRGGVNRLVLARRLRRRSP